jgi:RNA polymerase sigma-70 factor (ECF subfamily)
MLAIASAPTYDAFISTSLLLFIFGARRVSLSEVDRQLLQRCLDKAPRAWEDFVDRFLGLVTHVANHVAMTRGESIDTATRDDLVADVFLTLVADDFAVLRRFRRNCSLATYLTVISRRVIVRRLVMMRRGAASAAAQISNGDAQPSQAERAPRIENQEEVQRLLHRLDPKEANVVRMYHLEGKSYEEIGQVVGMSANSIGPMLSRARDKMRNGSERTA